MRCVFYGNIYLIDQVGGESCAQFSVKFILMVGPKSKVGPDFLLRIRRKKKRK